MRTVLPSVLPAALAVAAVSGALGCSLLVSFNEVALPCDGGACADATTEEGGDGRLDSSPADAKSHREAESDAPGDGNTCNGLSDGGVCGSARACNEAPICVAGVCMAQPVKDGTPCGTPKNECFSYPSCKSGICEPSTQYPDGYQWPGAPDPYSRCCGGEPVETTSDSNCGVCGIVCKSGESCTTIGGYYFCTGCGTSNAACWSDCCSSTDSSNGHCTPSNCEADVCKSPDICPKPSHCEALAAPVALVICTY